MVKPLLLTTRTLYLHTTKARSDVIGQYYSDYKQALELIIYQNLVHCLQILHSNADIFIWRLSAVWCCR